MEERDVRVLVQILLDWLDEVTGPLRLIEEYQVDNFMLEASDYNALFDILVPNILGEA